MLYGKSVIKSTQNRGCTVSGIDYFAFFTTDDRSEKVDWKDLNIKEEDIEIKEEDVEMKEDTPQTEESRMTARRGEKRALSRSCSPESAPKTKVQWPEVKNEPEQYENVVVIDWRKYILYLL